MTRNARDGNRKRDGELWMGESMGTEAPGKRPRAKERRHERESGDQLVTPWERREAMG